MSVVLHSRSCMEVMEEMPDEVIDLIVCDPPYKTISGGSNAGKAGRPTGILAKNDGKIFANNAISPDIYLPEFYRVLKDQSHLYIMCNFFNLEKMMAQVRTAGFKIHNLLIWKKNNKVTNRWYMKNVEYVIFARKGPSFQINNCGSATCVNFKNPSSPKYHPTEKPVGLMELYVGNSSQPGDLVFDPFMGSGTTAIACQNLGRDFIGCENDPEYFEIAERRVLI